MTALKTVTEWPEWVRQMQNAYNEFSSLDHLRKDGQTMVSQATLCFKYWDSPPTAFNFKNASPDGSTKISLNVKILVAPAAKLLGFFLGPHAGSQNWVGPLKNTLAGCKPLKMARLLFLLMLSLIIPGACLFPVTLLN